MPKKTYQCSIETRNLILRKVHDEAAQNNEMPSIKEICALCGLSRGTFYLYFPSMDAALSTLAQEHGEMLRHQVHAYQQDLLKQRLLPRAIASWAAGTPANSWSMLPKRILLTVSTLIRSSCWSMIGKVSASRLR